MADKRMPYSYSHLARILCVMAYSWLEIWRDKLGLGFGEMDVLSDYILESFVEEDFAVDEVLGGDFEEYPEEAKDKFIRLYTVIFDNLSEIDRQIRFFMKQAEKEVPDTVTLAILRVGLGELIYFAPDIPEKILNEAVLMAKRFCFNRANFIDAFLGDMFHYHYNEDW